jgi:methionyl-tRNA synthetase
MTLTAIVAPPPTPNGDLHVGHLSGPYLAADVLRRHLALSGGNVVAALSVDLHQSYVITTAERLGRDPSELALASHREVCSTLEAAGIQFDVVGMPGKPYTDYVSEWFRKLHSTGVFQRRALDVAYDPRRGRALFESYASGRCPTCLSHTKANICEGCGHPNDALDLIGLHPTGGREGDPVEIHCERRWVLELEPWRSALVEHIERLAAPLRPSVRRLLNELLAGPLPAFPVTFPSSWGVRAPFPDSPGEVLNVWAEMVPGHYWWLKQSARGANLFCGDDAVSYVQCLGFDNSFFYVVAHLALAFAARRAGLDALLPNALITNEFLLLDNYKFSTSQGHLIWGRDLLAQFSADEARFYLAWANPETQQANFSRSDFEQVIEKELRQRMRRLERLIEPGCASEPRPSELSRKLSSRFAAVHGVAGQSLRLIALTIATGLDLVNDLAESDPTAARSVLRALASGAAPLIPETAARLWTLAGCRLPVVWT